MLKVQSFEALGTMLGASGVVSSSGGVSKTSEACCSLTNLLRTLMRKCLLSTLREIQVMTRI